jgi:tetratricopeptide (TPR) repeat protein
MQMFLHLREKGEPHMKLATNKLEKRCSNAAELIYAGRYEEARDELGEFELWAGIGERPQLNFTPQINAEILLQCGTLSGWLGSAKQLDVQEKAKDLLTEALHIFQALNLKTKVSETQYELAECYWRLGAYDECRIVLAEAIKGLKDKELQAKIRIRQTSIEIWLGKYHEAWQMLEKAQPVFENANDALKGR